MKKSIKQRINQSTLVACLMAIVFMVSCGDKAEKKEEPLIKRTKTEVAKKEPRKKLSPGEKAFLLCAACHNLKKGEPHKVGPNLNGIFGRKAASLEDFTYSEALQNSGITWNEEHIRNWLNKPSDYVPGTTMAFIGIKNKEQQDLLIEYLKEETK